MAGKTRVKQHKKRMKTGAVITVSTHDRMTNAAPMPKHKPSISMTMRGGNGMPECSAYGIEDEDDAKHVAGLVSTLNSEMAASKAAKSAKKMPMEHDEG